VNVKRTIAEFLMARCSSVTSEVVSEHWRKLDHQLASSSLSVVTPEGEGIAVQQL